MQWHKESGQTWGCFVLSFLLVLISDFSGQCEGTKELNSNNTSSTQLYMCNDFAGHCSGSGLRSQFASYDNTNSATDVDRLYFVTLNASEVVYMGFKGAGLTNPATPVRHIVYRIKNAAGTIIQAEQNLPTSGTGFISTFLQATNGPNQLILTPPYGGYDAAVFSPPVPGVYFIEFSVRRNDNNNFYIGDFDLSLFDITVANTVTQLAKPGRVYSKCWQFYETSNFYGMNYIISDDSIVTSALFSGMSGGHWNQYSNQTGCGSDPNSWTVNRKSLHDQQALFPQFKIFLNPPDPALFPPAITPGAFVAPLPYGVLDCNTGHILFHIKVNKPGNVELTLTFPAPYQTMVYNKAVISGDNTIEWDGLDGSSPRLVVPNNTPVQFTVKYINGLTNLPLYDVEGNDNGFTIALVSPAGTAPAVFWDDSNIPGGTINSVLPGCTSPPGCHPWASSGGSGFGDQNTMNTWWYNVSTSTPPLTIYEYRKPLMPTFVQEPPQGYCVNSGNHTFSVYPEENSDTYTWSYSPPAGVTIIQPTPASYAVTVTFGAGATSGTLSVYGTNTHCNMSGPAATLPVTIHPAPTPLITGPSSVCSGQAGSVYTTEAGKVQYLWALSPGGTKTGGGTFLNNTMTVTWNTPGPQWVSVNYQNPVTFCTAASPTVYPVTVNSHPVPTLSGSTIVCAGYTVTYTTQAGQSDYVWSISPGGTLAGGGTSTSSTIDVTWMTPGAQWVTVSYKNPVTGCTATSPGQINVTVNNLPTPTFLSGVSSACVGVSGNTYTTQPGMSGYIWVITNGTVNNGGTPLDSWITVTWNSTGPQSVSVNYNYPGSSCTGASPAVMTVTVNPLPVPSVITGNVLVCRGDPGNVYTTQSGKLGYTWIVNGGNITGGGNGFDFAEVTWTTAGVQSVGINYTDPVTNCAAAAPAMYYVTVKPLPDPTFVSGDASVCLDVPGHVYTTQAGMLNYVWTITGGVISPGGGGSDHTATVTWTTPGNQSVSVGYTDPVTQCSSATPAILPVFVKPLPVPSFTAGPVSVCRNSTGNVYETQPGMIDYTWTVTGGTITDGGTFSSNTATVKWLDPGVQSIHVGYTDPLTMCTSTAATAYPVTVKPLPVPSLSGPAAACLNASGYQYFTETDKLNYDWTIAGGTLSAGPSPGIVSAVWDTPGTGTIAVTYTDVNGCDPESPTQIPVVVNTLPVPGLSGPDPVCTGVQAVYTTEGGMDDYDWFVSPGGVIGGGGGDQDNTVQVTWTVPGPMTVSVNYAIGTTGCTGASATSLPVTVNAVTLPVIQPTPSAQVCVTTSVTYTTQPGMTAYAWSVSSGGSIVSENNHEIIVKWNATGAQWVRVIFTNPENCTVPAPVQTDVPVNPLPVTAITAGPGPQCESLPHLFTNPADPDCTFDWSVVPVGMGSVTDGQGTHEAIIEWQSYGQAQVLVTATNKSTSCFTSDLLAVTVNPKTVPAFIPCFDVVTTTDARKFELRGAQPYAVGHGVFSGNRVSLNSATGRYEFDPFGASAGSYNVTYTYTNVFSCPASAPVVSITVQNSPFTCGAPLVDVRDGQSYETALFGGKCWMTENLAYGTVLDMATPSTDNCINERYCPPDDAGCAAFGGLYQWDELMRYGTTSAGQGICPPAWHLPTEGEWQSLLGAVVSWATPPDGVSGAYLKDLNNPGGFHSKNSGLLYLGRLWSFYNGDLTGSMYWTGSAAGAGRAGARGVNVINFSTSRYSGSRANAFSARCVKD